MEENKIKKSNLVFLGTPEYAAWNLEYLLTNGLSIDHVVSQPDRKAGRGHQVSATPVKHVANRYGIEVFQPEDINSDRSREFLTAIRPAIVIVVAYGQILKRRILSIPEFGCINLHASLLPEYRGAAPIQRVLTDGRKVTGVTTMKMNLKMDAGKILMQREIELSEKETAKSLYEKIKPIGGSVLLETVKGVLNQQIKPVSQDESRASYCSKIIKEEGHVDFRLQSAETIYNLWRGFITWPEIFFQFRGKLVKIKDIELVSADEMSAEPAQILNIHENGFCISCKSGKLNLKLLQFPGKSPVAGRAFLNGYHLGIGDSLL